MIDVTDDSLTLTVTIAARPETVFALFTDPEALAQWMGATHGVATVEPRVGGALRVEFPGADKVVMIRIESGTAVPGEIAPGHVGGPDIKPPLGHQEFRMVDAAVPGKATTWVQGVDPAGDSKETDL